MVADLKDLVDEVLPRNTKRVKYFAAMTKKLKLIEVYEDALELYGDEDEAEDAYEALDRLRVAWRNQEIKQIKANLEQIQYRFKGAETITAVSNGRRLEQVGRW